MITEGLRNFNIPDAKPPYAQWPVPIDISSFLDGDTISALVCTAVIDDENQTDATSDVIDAEKCTYSTDSIIPFIKAGTPGTDYIAKCEVTTSTGNRDVWTIRWSVLPAWSSWHSSGVGLDAVLVS